MGTFGGPDNGRNGGVDYGWGRFWNGEPLDPNDIRQWTSEVGRWVAEAEQLRRDLRGLDIDPRELERILGELKQLQDPRSYQNVEELVRRQAEVTERLKRFEYSVRQQVDDGKAVALSNAEEVPESHRPLVEEYFRSLARSAR